MAERAQDIRDDLTTVRDLLDDIERRVKTAYGLLDAIEESANALEEQIDG
jgi:hypothetical protein